MNVRMAQQLLQGIATAEVRKGTTPGSEDFASALIILQRMCKYFAAPLNADLDLSAQLIQLSSLAHETGFLFHQRKKQFIPSQLYHDLQTYVKAVFVIAARGQRLLTGYNLPIFLLGTDQQEEQHGSLRTVTHNQNFSTFELQNNITITGQIATVYERHPDWRRTDARRGFGHGVDIIRPESVTGSMDVDCVDLRGCWAAGRRAAEADLRHLFTSQHIESFWTQIAKGGCSLLAPSGKVIGVGKEKGTPKGTIFDESVESEEEEEEEVNEPVPDDAYTAPVWFMACWRPCLCMSLSTCVSLTAPTAGSFDVGGSGAVRSFGGVRIAPVHLFGWEAGE
eukprot:GHVU01164461.1.p1 GENE.GHVU01164461.1~~GHVU01164461.1.p1  ORF type:complete len:337 (+),score=49.02 GHVU01164461.1:567-1577(+)